MNSPIKKGDARLCRTSGSSIGQETPYPSSRRERDLWIELRRPRTEPRPSDGSKPVGAWLEQELAAEGGIATVATVLLTNRECPWRCLMCDLWRNTTLEPIPPGAIPWQIDVALERLAAGRSGRSERVFSQLKLYNSGSFFDPKAIPASDYPAIAQRAHGLDRVIVECHPKLVGERILSFRDLLGDTELEVAMGLETADPAALELLNKGMTLADFVDAAKWLNQNRIHGRAFVLLKPPFHHEAEARAWTLRSVQFALDCQIEVVSIIPVRGGNGALEALSRCGQFSPPTLGSLEWTLEQGIRLGRGRVFADTWDLEKFSMCASCFSARKLRIERMNLTQQAAPAVCCACLDANTASAGLA